MAEVSFFTPIHYTHAHKNWVETCREKVDNFFHWNCFSGKKAYVIHTASGKEKAFLSSDKASLRWTAAKVALCFTLVVPLFMLAAKLALRLTHSFQIMDLQKKLGKGLELGGAQEQVEALFPHIHLKHDIPEIEWISKNTNAVFKLSAYPNVVFKMVTHTNGSAGGIPYEQIIPRRYNSSIEALKVKLTHRLGLLILPKTKIFAVQHAGTTYQVIAEECLPFSRQESVQQRNYQVLNGLSESVRQLAVFIQNFGFCDVTPRNIPILDEEPGFAGHRRIGLIDIEHHESAQVGFTGGVNGSCGLIGSVGQDLLNQAAACARAAKVPQANVEQARLRRLAELQESNVLYQFYADNHIAGPEPIHVDIDTLPINLDEEREVEEIAGMNEAGEIVYNRRIVTLRAFAGVLKDYINERLQNAPQEEALSFRRLVPLNTNARPLASYPDHWISTVGQAFAQVGSLRSFYEDGYFMAQA